MGATVTGANSFEARFANLPASTVIAQKPLKFCLHYDSVRD
jgi:hypothetical protein